MMAICQGPIAKKKLSAFIRTIFTVVKVVKIGIETGLLFYKMYFRPGIRDFPECLSPLWFAEHIRRGFKEDNG